MALPFQVERFHNDWQVSKKHRVAVAYISRSEMGSIAHAWGAAGACIRLLRELDDVDVQLMADTHHLDIAAKRCIICNDAIDAEADAMVMIDDDMALKPNSLVPLIKEWLAGREITAAPYYGKERFPNTMCMDARHQAITFPVPYTEPILAHMAGTGVMCIDKAVVEHFLQVGFPLFVCDHTSRGDLTATEDYYFTELSTYLGHEVWVVPPVVPHIKYFQSYDGSAPADEVVKPGLTGLYKVTMAGAIRTLDSMTLPELMILLSQSIPASKAAILAELNRRRVFTMGETLGCRGVR